MPTPKKNTKKGGLKQSLSPEQLAALKNDIPDGSVSLEQTPIEETIPVAQPTVEVPHENTQAPSGALSAEDAALLMQAKAAQVKLAQAGAVDSGLQNAHQLPPPDDTYLEIDGLPSGGVFYGTQIYGQPLKVNDLLLIQSVDEKNISARFDQIFKRRIWGIEPGELLVIDEMFLALWLRATSFEGYNFPSMPFTCTNCGHEAKPDEAEFNWPDVGWDTSDIESISKLHEKGYYETVLPQSKIPVKIYLRKRKHLNIVNNLLKRDFWNYNKDASNEYYELLLMAVILDMGVGDLKQTAAFIQELPAVDFVTLIKEINKASVDSEPVVKVRCPSCQEVNPVTGYPFRPDIYLPTDS